MHCPGSIALTRDAVRESSSYADEGTAAHELAQRALTYDKHAVFFLGEQIQVGNNIFTVSHDMAEAVQVYLTEVRQRVGKDGTLLIEQRLSFSESIGVPGQFGTGDAIIVSGDGKVVHVVDLKYGRGVRVEAERNEQLLTYGVAALETFDTILSDVETVKLVVAQPRLDHIDEWEVPVATVREHADRLRLAAQAALEGCAVYEATGQVPGELLRPGEHACRFCPAKATCPALRAAVSEAVYSDFKALDAPEALSVIGEPPTPPAAKLGALYGVLDLIEDWCRGVRAEVERQVAAGMTVIGLDGEPMKLIEGRKGARKWADAAAAEAALAGLLPPEKVYKPRELVTPAVAQKALGKANWPNFEHLVVQTDGRPKVALGSDPSPPYRGSASASEFAELGDAE